VAGSKRKNEERTRLRRKSPKEEVQTAKLEIQARMQDPREQVHACGAKVSKSRECKGRGKVRECQVSEQKQRVSPQCEANKSEDRGANYP
jgi:hypothetical protein